MNTKIRKITKFDPCPSHKSFFHGMARYRKADYFSQGGPSVGPCCSGAGCRISPGRDIFIEEVCRRTYNTYTLGTPFSWQINKDGVTI